jgi:hypothetical protein
MPLTPKRPPGRSSRKARAFAAEIHQLHAQGHSCEAIREALADVDVVVSVSTVQREVVRHAKHLTSTPSATSAFVKQGTALPADSHKPASYPAPAPLTETAPRPALPAIETRSGKDIAQAFVSGRITNPLIRNRSNHEDSRH